MVDTTISDLHRFHYGSGSKKAKSMLIHADKNPKHWLAPQLFEMPLWRQFKVLSHEGTVHTNIHQIRDRNFR